ncbi:MAG: hypothetical protein V3W32_09220 [Gemmatimonadota bacterium]
MVRQIDVLRGLEAGSCGDPLGPLEPLGYVLRVADTLNGVPSVH